MASQSTSVRTARRVPSFQRNAFIAVLAMWAVVVPLGLHGRVAQDAVPYVAAGQLARTHPGEVYAVRNGDLFDLRPRFRKAWCAVAPEGTDCTDLAVGFVSSPPTIPVIVGLGTLGDTTGTLLMQFAAAWMLAGGMWLLWKRLAHRSRRAPTLLVATAVLLTPMAMVPIGLGQTSPILFLSVCLGISARTTRRRVADTAAWTAALVLKVFPAALVLVLIWRRKWRMIAWAAAATGVLLVGSLAFVPVATWGDFVRTTLELSSSIATNPYNGSVSALVVHLVGGSTSGTTVAVARLVSLAAAGTVCWFSMRGADDDTRWAAGYLALVLLTPLVWWHYVWVAVGAIGVAIAGQRKLDDRTIAVLPAIALTSVIPSIPNANGHSIPVVQALWLLAFATTFCVLARRSAVRDDERVRRPVAS